MTSAPPVADGECDDVVPQGTLEGWLEEILDQPDGRNSDNEVVCVPCSPTLHKRRASDANLTASERMSALKWRLSDKVVPRRLVSKQTNPLGYPQWDG